MASGSACGEFEHDLQILDLFAEARERIEFAANVVGLVDDFLRGFLVVPESFAGHLRLEFGEALVQSGRRQRNLRRWVSLSAAVAICGLTMSNMAAEHTAAIGQNPATNLDAFAAAAAAASIPVAI